MIRTNVTMQSFINLLRRCIKNKKKVEKKEKKEVYRYNIVLRFGINNFNLKNKSNSTYCSRGVYAWKETLYTDLPSKYTRIILREYLFNNFLRIYTRNTMTF